jgi:glycosyltransferase involved in cell wall biosynthesis
VLNVDGLDWKREKWPWVAKKYIQFSEYLATILPNAFLTDSYVVQDYYVKRYGDQPPYIPYGSEVEVVSPGGTLKQFGLEARKYVLFVGRLVPENCAHHLIAAFRQIETDFKCVIVGDAPYADGYQAELKSLASGDPRIIFTGYVFGRGYNELGSNAHLFVETSGVGGTHPALVEAMAFGNCVIAHNTPENQETIGNSGLVYDGKIGSDNLAKILKGLLDQPDKVEKYRNLARLRAKASYSWKAVTDSYEMIFYQTRGEALPEHLSRVIR